MSQIACAYDAGGKNRLEVHQGSDGKCVIVKWCSLHQQYQTAPFRRRIESPQGGYYCGRSPWHCNAHKLSRGCAMKLFNEHTKGENK